MKQALQIHLGQAQGDILIFMTGAEDIEATGCVSRPLAVAPACVHGLVVVLRGPRVTPHAVAAATYTLTTLLQLLHTGAVGGCGRRRPPPGGAAYLLAPLR